MNPEAAPGQGVEKGAVVEADRALELVRAPVAVEEKEVDVGGTLERGRAPTRGAALRSAAGVVALKVAY